MPQVRIHYDKLAEPAPQGCVNQGANVCHGLPMMHAKFGSQETWCCISNACMKRARQWLYANLGPKELRRLKAEHYREQMRPRTHKTAKPSPAA